MSSGMEHPPLARHAALQPLSREHFNGLVTVRNLRRAAHADADARLRAAAALRAAWSDEIGPHFEDEERLLMPLMSDADRRRLLSEHAALRSKASELIADRRPAPTLLLTVADLLESHIRWEERELFPAVQRVASADDLRRLTEHAGRIERDRPGARRRQDPRGHG